MSPRQNFGAVKISGELLNRHVSLMLNSDVEVVELLAYERANDTWKFLCKGPDFVEHYKGGEVSVADAHVLEQNRRFWEENETG